jgi:hypothetical protein
MYLVLSASAVRAHPTSRPRLHRHSVPNPERARADDPLRLAQLRARSTVLQLAGRLVRFGRLSSDVGAEADDDARGLVAEAHGARTGYEAHLACVVD